MSTQQANPPHRYPVREKHFRSDEALWRQYHDRPQPRCDHCRRPFATQDGLNAHNRSKHPPNAPASSQSTKHHCHHGSDTLVIRYNENNYAGSSTVDPMNICDLLRAKCHSRELLKKNGYHIADDSGMIFNRSQKNPDAPPTILFRAPGPTFLNPKRRAVVLDCEMVGCEDGRDEAVHLSAIDFITGEVLINSIVKPQQPIRDWRTNFTGLSPADMAIATARGATLKGAAEARREVWKYIDENTILVGQSLNYDLDVLGISHATVVDSMILTREAVFDGKKAFRRWGLQELCKDILGLEIQQSRYGKGHDSLEDSLATRELVLRCLRSPGFLESWARKARRSCYQGSKKKRSNRQPSQRSAKPPNLQTHVGHWYHQSSSDDEALRWSDVVDYDMWPKSPPDWTD